MWRITRFALAFVVACILVFLGYGLVSEPEPPAQSLVLPVELNEDS